MVATACLTLLFLSDFRTGEGEPFSGPGAVTAAMLPLPLSQPAPASAARELVGPPEPARWPTVVARANRELPERSEVPELAAKSAAVAMATNDADGDAVERELGEDELAEHEFAGPPAPSIPAIVVAAADDGIGEAVGPEMEGPPCPARLARAEVPPAEQPAAHVGHGLPFDPLAVGPFRGGTEQPSVQPDVQNAFASFLADQSDLHTVEYTREVHHTIRSGETISQVLAELGVDALEIDQWVKAAAKKHSLNRIYAGQDVRLLIHGPKTQLLRLQLEANSQQMLVAERTADGVQARLEQIRYEDGIRVAGAEIDHSLYMAAQSQAVPDKIISDMAEVLGWDINLGRELVPGSRFRVVYEEKTRVDTGEVSAGRLLAVELTNRSKKYEGFYFKTPDGSRSGYYDRKGESLGRAFLRYPVAFSRISSQFTTKRFHPVLKRNIPHYGVDFAAATGTPVRAVADGKVLKAGWYGGNGRFVKLRHDSVYESGYAHLSRIASSVREGRSVKQGQIIGYVGSTGLATGPHLHFALYRYGKYIDPLHTKLPRPQSLVGSSLAAFRTTVDAVDRQYAQAEQEQDGRSRVRTAAVTSGEAPSR